MQVYSYLGVFSLLPHHLILGQAIQAEGGLYTEALAACLVDVVHQVGPVEQLDGGSEAEHGLALQVSLHKAVDVAPQGNLGGLLFLSPPKLLQPYLQNIRINKPAPLVGIRQTCQVQTRVMSAAALWAVHSSSKAAQARQTT